MTATTYAPPLNDVRPVRQPGIARLTAVEMRKMVDTRAGTWLVGIIAALTVAFVTLGVVTGSGRDRTFALFFELTLYPVALLLPVLGILMVTTEWSQRTALTTFALTPRRERIAVAKFLAATGYALLSLLTSLAVAAVGNLTVLALDRGSGDWSLPASALGQAALYQVIAVAMGVAFGMLFMNTPLAIVLYFVLPIAWTILVNVVPGVKDVATWADVSAATDPLATDTMTADTWAHLSTSATLWLLVPMALGVVRLRRRELT